MAKIKYQVLESTIGTHACYAKAMVTGTMTFDEMCEKACEDCSVEPEIMKAAVARYMKKAQEFLVLGYRIPLGNDFLTLRPVLQCSVKDVVDKDGNVVTPATPDMVRANNGVSKVGASVSAKFSKLFELKTSWTKVVSNEAADEEEDDATVTEEENAQNNSSSQQNSGSQQSGGSSQEGTEGDYTLRINKYGTGTMNITDSNGQEISDNASIHSGSMINISVVPEAGKVPTASINGTTVTLTEQDGTYTGSVAMPTKVSVLDVNSNPSENNGVD